MKASMKGKPLGVKCDCGHYSKDHYNGEGSCNKCACTWYHPNHRDITKGA